MKEIKSWECEFCGKVIQNKEAATQHEEMCRWIKAGHAVWIENEKVCHAPKIPEELFGPHSYEEYCTSDCAHGCGCWMGDSRSGGPVDPFGPCPMNPMMNRGTRS